MFGRNFDAFPSFTAMGICRWEWFDFRRLPLKMPFSTEVVGAGAAAAAGGNRRKKSLKSFSYIRRCLGAILMLFRPSLSWGFAAGSGSILGDCLLKMPF